MALFEVKGLFNPDALIEMEGLAQLPQEGGRDDHIS